MALPAALLLGASPAVTALAAASVALVLLQRLLIALRFGYAPADALLHPLGMVALLAIALNSARLHHRGGASWKGRPTGPPRA